MTHICINHRQMTFDFCRNCKGYDIDCPEYLGDGHDTRQTKQPLQRDTNYDASVNSSFPEWNKTAEKPFYFGHVELLHEVSMPKVNYDFIKRFRRFQE